MAKRRDQHRSIENDGAAPTACGDEREAVVDLAAARRRTFLDRLYREHMRDLTGWLTRRYGPGPPEPEEIAHMAFAKIAEVKDVGRLTSARNFLFTTAVRCAIDLFRKNDTLRRFEEEQMALFGDEVGEITPEYVYLSRERLAALSNDLNDLSDRQRETVLRSRVLGQTFDQIARETGWSKSAVGRYLEAGLDALTRKKLARGSAHAADRQTKDAP